MSAVVGGLTAARVADDEINEVMAGLKDEAQASAQAGGWNGIFLEFTPISYSSQVVAGINYFVKCKVGGDKYAHVRVYKPLPHTGESPQVAKVLVDMTADAPIAHF